MGLYHYSIYQAIRRNARFFNDRVALKFRDQKIGYGEFLEKVDELASGLANSGLKKGDRIGVFANNSLEYFYLYGAAAKIGAIMLPMNWRLNPEEIKYVILDGSPKVIFVESEFQPIIKPMASEFDFVDHYYSMGQEEGNFRAFNDLMKNDGICFEVDVCIDDSYLIIHTAAVQGKPRGAILTHRNLMAASSLQMYYWCLTKEDVNINMLPLFHTIGVCIASSIMHAGGTNIILPKFDVDVALKHIQEDKVTIFCEFQPMLKALLDKAQADNYDLSSLRIVTGIDEPKTFKKLEEMTGATSWAGYGQTETSGLICFSPYFERVGSVGMPGYMTEVEVVDDEGNILEAGKTGEIVVRGPMVFQGYFNLGKDNEYTFRDGWHHTGDKGYFDSDGYLWYMGRTSVKELIKTGGENVYPAEVEKVLLEHPLVHEAVVIGVPDPQWTEAIKAVCVVKKGESLSEAELIEFVAARIARFKKPKYVVFVSNLPKAQDGLVDRERVKADYRNL